MNPSLSKLQASLGNKKDCTQNKAQKYTTSIFQCPSAMTHTITYVYGANSISVDIPVCPGCRLVHDFDDFSSMPSDVDVLVSVAGLSINRTVCELQCVC